MKQLTEPQFQAVREGIAGAHLLLQRIAPVLKARHTKLDNATRVLLTQVPEPIRTAFAVVCELSSGEPRAPLDFSEKPAQPLSNIDPKTFRNELENVSALRLPDLEYEMCCALEELPMFAEESREHALTPFAVKRIMAWAWEAGRRYAFIEAIAVFSTTQQEVMDGTIQIFEQARDRYLDLPAPEAQQPGNTDASDDERSLDPEPDAPGKKPGPQPVN